MPAPSWVSKDPSDMSLEELQAAKEVVSTSVAAAQQELQWQSTAQAHLIARIAAEYELSIPGIPDVGSLPDYPADQVVSKFSS